ncbi:MAG: hypothetical protein E7301_09035 [Butyrivibrio sp.]|nr:hypothetical protein [Butyrivibrio sp.]
MTEVAIFISEYLATLGIDAGRKKFLERIDESKLRTALQSYIQKQHKYNKMCSMAEEVDFEGLSEFVKNNLLDDVTNRVFSPKRKVRGEARNHAIAEAISYAKANTDEARKRVAIFVSDSIDIIRAFYKSGFSRRDYILASEITATLDESIDDAANNISKTIEKTVQDSENRLTEKIDHLQQNNTDGMLFSIDKAIKMVESGEISYVGSGIQKVLNHISIMHPLYPLYGYDFSEGMVKSKPLTKDARALYPSRMTVSGKVKMDLNNEDNDNFDPLDYSYRHQKPLMMEVSKAVKYLGDVIDPVQDDVKGIEGQTLIAYPPEFPPAFPCSIKVGNEAFFEYVLLRTQEIEDDGTCVIGNREQKGSFYFEVRINPKNMSKPDFKISMNQAENKDLLNYVRFMAALKRDRDIHIYVLSEHKDLIAGTINQVNYKSGFETLEAEIDFLERICDIEKYFDVKLNINGEISENDYEIIVQVSELVRNEEVIGSWTEASFTGIIDNHFREELIKMKNDESELSYVGTYGVVIFDANIEFKYMRSYKTAKIKDFEKIKKKVAVLEDGDSIKITMIPGNSNIVIDTLHIPDQMSK